jgi:hypothetical protein
MSRSAARLIELALIWASASVRYAAIRRSGRRGDLDDRGLGILLLTCGHG